MYKKSSVYVCRSSKSSRFWMYTYCSNNNLFLKLKTTDDIFNIFQPSLVINTFSHLISPLQNNLTTLTRVNPQNPISSAQDLNPKPLGRPFVLWNTYMANRPLRLDFAHRNRKPFCAIYTAIRRSLSSDLLAHERLILYRFARDDITERWNSVGVIECRFSRMIDWLAFHGRWIAMFLWERMQSV